MILPKSEHVGLVPENIRSKSLIHHGRFLGHASQLMPAASNDIQEIIEERLRMAKLEVERMNKDRDLKPSKPH
jgi:hypothetical protein